MATCSATNWTPSQIAWMPLVRTGCGLRADWRRCDVCTETCGEPLTWTSFGGVQTVVLTSGATPASSDFLHVSGRLLTHPRGGSCLGRGADAGGMLAWKPPPVAVLCWPVT